MLAPRLDVDYTNGVIAAREKYLLKDRIFRLCELQAQEAFRSLLESGFGGGAETTDNVYEYEKLIAVEEEKLDGFIRTYSPSDSISAYLLAPRDFHNAKALVKAQYLGENPEKMLSPQGKVEVALIKECVESGNFSALEEKNPELKKACEEAVAQLEDEPSGAKVGEIFEKATYAYLGRVVKRNKALKKLISAKADMINILTAFRAGEEKIALDKYLPSGNLKKEELSPLFYEDLDKVKKAFENTAQAEFVKACLKAKQEKLPYTHAEKILASFDGKYFSERKYELEKSEPFLFYVFRRKAENANVRVIFACLLAGLSETEIKKRLRTF